MVLHTPTTLMAPTMRHLSKEDLIAAIIERRTAIRYCRDQRGDDRCFLDYYEVWKFVKGTTPPPRTRDAGMPRCEMFFRHCNAEAPDEVEPGDFCVIEEWDPMLHNLRHVDLAKIFIRINYAILRHRDVEKLRKRPRNANDDRRLFRETLPEKIPADFRLPSEHEFLHNAVGRHGCEAFWASHAGCGPECNLHAWGPCSVRNN